MDGCCFICGGVIGFGAAAGGSFFIIFGDGSVSVYLLFFCERVGVWSIPEGGLLVRVAGTLSDGGLFFRSLVSWLAMADFFFLFYFAKVTADIHSAELIRLGFRALALAAIPKLGVPWRGGRRILLGLGVCLLQTGPRTMAAVLWKMEVVCCNFPFFRVLSIKDWMHCANLI